jgi:hypothetical protein
MALTSEEAEKAARKAIREQKKQERKETLQQRVDALKAKFRKQQRTGLFAGPERAGHQPEHGHGGRAAAGAIDGVIAASAGYRLVCSSARAA